MTLVNHPALILSVSEDKRVKRRFTDLNDPELLFRFAQAYKGNATDAARACGLDALYSKQTLFVTACKIRNHPTVKKFIEEREKDQIAKLKKLYDPKKTHKRIATREDRQAFWTSVMEDPEQPMQERLRASELLGKSNMDFTDRIQAEIKSEHTVKIEQLTDAQLADQAAAAIELLKGTDYATIQDQTS